MGTYDIANKDLSEMVPEYVVGIGVSWTVFDGAARYRNVKAAKLRESQADDYLLQTELDRITSYNVCYTKLLRSGPSEEISVPRIPNCTVCSYFSLLPSRSFMSKTPASALPYSAGKAPV